MGELMTFESPVGSLIVVDLKEYEQLKEDSKFLQNLHDAGVDNWEGYHYGWTGFDDE
jgi:hypothetical protein